MTTDVHIDRFWQKVDRRGPDECWLWLGGRDEFGYGVFYAAMRKHRAHRWLLGYLRGTPLVGQQTGIEDACHRCDNPPCVNPAHLYVGTRRRNVQDALERRRLWQQKITACPAGHPYDEANTYVKPSGARACRTCRAIADRERKEQQKAARTTCRQGHPLSGDNLIVSKNGTRKCLICNRERMLRVVAAREARKAAQRTLLTNKAARK